MTLIRPLARRRLFNKLNDVEAMFNDPTADSDFAKAIKMGVEIASTTPQSLPATGTSSIFWVTGGRVALLALFGEVTTVIQTQACNTKYVYTPSVGSVADLSAVVDISAAAVGTRLSLVGLPATAALLSTGAIFCPSAPVILPVGPASSGGIGINTSATNTGEISYTAFWLPIDSGAAVVNPS